MTPCEKLGYKVGDRFVVIRPELVTGGMSAGDIIILHRDDGSSMPLFRKEGEDYAHDCGYLEAIKPLRKLDNTLKTGDTIERDGKKYRVTLEEIPQYDFKTGMLCQVDWDGSEICTGHSKSKTVVYLRDGENGRSQVAYATPSGTFITGYVNTSNLRPE